MIPFDGPATPYGGRWRKACRAIQSLVVTLCVPGSPPSRFLQAEPLARYGEIRLGKADESGPADVDIPEFPLKPEFIDEPQIEHAAPWKLEKWDQRVGARQKHATGESVPPPALATGRDGKGLDHDAGPQIADDNRRNGGEQVGDAG